MTGLPTLTVELDDTTGSGTWPYDITTKVNLPAGWTIDRGRSNEFGENETGGLSLQVDNTDGRFTLGNTTYDLAVDQRIRFTESIGTTVFRRHVGYVQDWPQKWDSPLAKQSLVKVVSKDRFSRLERRDMPASLLRAEILASGPVAYYTLGEAEGATAAGDTSGHAHPSLGQTGSGAAVIFGASGGPAYGVQTVATFAGGKHLATPSGTVATPGATAYSVSCFFETSSSNVGLFLIGLASQVTLGLDVNGKLVTSTFMSADAYNDGTTHHFALTYASGITTLYVDGVSIGTHGSVFDSGTDTLTLTIGSDTLTAWTGELSHVGVWDRELTGAEVATQAAAGLDGATTDSSDERLARLATYARIPTAERDFETGILASVGPQLGESKVLPAMHAVVKAEGGSLFVSGDGKLTAHNRTHRVYTSTQAASLVISAADVDPGDLLVSRDKQYLKNAVTGSRRGAAVQRAVDEDSVTQYEEYPDSDLSDLLVLTDTEVLDAITWRKGAYAQPLDRLANITLDLFTLPDSVVEAALALELGDRITVTGLPTTSPQASIDLLIEGIKETGSLTTWRLAFNTVPAALFQAWVLGDTTYGVLGSTTRLHY